MLTSFEQRKQEDLQKDLAQRKQRKPEPQVQKPPSPPVQRIPSPKKEHIKPLSPPKVEKYEYLFLI
jgi:hypothetical protein